MATAEPVDRAGRANGSIARRPPGRPRVVRPASATPRIRRPHRTAPIPTHLPGTRPDRTVPGSPRDGTFAPRTSPNPQPTVATPPEYHRTAPEYAACRMTFRSRPAESSVSSSPRRTALAIALLFGISSVFTLAAPSETFAWDNELVQLIVRGRPRRPDQPEPRERRAQGAQGRFDGSPASPAGGART